MSGFRRASSSCSLSTHTDTQCLFNYRDKLKIANSSVSVKVPFFKRNSLEGKICMLAIYMHVRDCRVGLFIEFLIFPTRSPFFRVKALRAVFLCAWRMATIGIYHFGKLCGLTWSTRAVTSTVDTHDYLHFSRKFTSRTFTQF